MIKPLLIFFGVLLSLCVLSKFYLLSSDASAAAADARVWLQMPGAVSPIISKPSGQEVDVNVELWLHVPAGSVANRFYFEVNFDNSKLRLKGSGGNNESFVAGSSFTRRVTPAQADNSISMDMNVGLGNPINGGGTGNNVLIGTLKFKAVNTTTATDLAEATFGNIQFRSPSEVVSSINNKTNLEITINEATTASACTSVAITTGSGVTMSDEVNEEGGPIYVSSSNGGNRTLTVNRTAGVSVNFTVSDPTPSPAQSTAIPLDKPTIVPTGNDFTIRIPQNPASGYDRVHTISTQVGSGTTASCKPVTLIVKRASECTYESTQVRFRQDGSGAWVQGSQLQARVDQKFYVGGFHNGRTNTIPSDTSLTVTDPSGNVTDISGNDSEYIPQSEGKYAFKAVTTGKLGENCEGSSEVTIGSPERFTVSYAISQNRTDLEKTDPAQIDWKPYQDSDGREPILTNFTFVGAQPGQNLTLFVRFKNNRGELSDITLATIKYLGPEPKVTKMNCGYDSAGGGTKLEIFGASFGTRNTSGEAVKVTDLTGSRSGRVTLWDRVSSNTPTESVPTLGPTAGEIATPTPRPVGLEDKIEVKVAERLEGNIVAEVTLGDGRIAKGACVIGVTTVAFSAKRQCREGDFSETGVEVSIFDKSGGNKKALHSLKINLGPQGDPLDFQPVLEVGKDYALLVKIPRALTKRFDFKAEEGTMNLGTVIAPVGDISPRANPDGAINALDRSELIRQWAAISDTARTGDFNGDSRVNSIDYSCLRENNGKRSEVF